MRGKSRLPWMGPRAPEGGQHSHRDHRTAVAALRRTFSLSPGSRCFGLSGQRRGIWQRVSRAKPRSRSDSVTAWAGGSEGFGCAVATPVRLFQTNETLLGVLSSDGLFLRSSVFTWRARELAPVPAEDAGPRRREAPAPPLGELLWSRAERNQDFQEQKQRLRDTRDTGLRL